MNLILSLVIAFPLGLLVNSRTAAQLVNVAVFLFGYVSTAVLLLLEWTGGSEVAFGAFPSTDLSQGYAFVGISAAVFGLSALLVHWGSAVRARRAQRRGAAVAATVR